jgi:hypothetical protein
LPIGALINGFTLPSFLPFFTVFLAILFLLFYGRIPVLLAALHGCNRNAKEIKSRNFLLL